MYRAACICSFALRVTSVACLVLQIRGQLNAVPLLPGGRRQCSRRPNCQVSEFRRLHDLLASGTASRATSFRHMLLLMGHADGTALSLCRTSNKKSAGEKPSANKPAMQD
jgi:hypothetical protein